MKFVGINVKEVTIHLLFFRYQYLKMFKIKDKRMEKQ